ncbi:MFS transporter [Streptomyces sp. RTGN2]|uniref:MFS transporter n=1 Tax=Streptomyces sp. RTGN2 TaxID=3016525 RepID=UPI00255608A2|nr:MFS transporter [Streptomyces sp. RTGN2]
MTPTTTPPQTSTRQLLTRMPVLPLLTIAFLTRVTVAALPITLLLTLAHTYGYARAGAVNGGYTLVLAFLAPLRARILDRWGTGRALVLMGATTMTLMTLVAISTAARWPWWTTLLLTIGAGSTTPPLNAALRASWRRLTTGPAQLKAVHSADSILEEAGFVLAPLAAGAAIALLGAGRAYEVTVACYLLVVTAYLTAAHHYRLTHHPATTTKQETGTPRRKSWLGPLARPRIVAIMLPLLVMGCVFGGTGVLLPAYAQAHHATAWIGPLLAATSTGGVIGGLLYATITWNQALWQKYRLLTLGFAIPACFLVLAHPLWLLALLLVVCGLFITPLFINAFLLLDATATDDIRIEANTWVGASTDIANGILAIIIGTLTAHQNWNTALLLLSCCATAGVVIALASPRHDHPPAHAGTQPPLTGTTTGPHTASPS